jgi:hypothetical protein
MARSATVNRFAPFFRWLASLLKGRYVAQLESDLAAAILRAEKAEAEREAMLHTLLNYVGAPLQSTVKREPPKAGPRVFRTPSAMKHAYEAKAYDVSQRKEKADA